MHDYSHIYVLYLRLFCTLYYLHVQNVQKIMKGYFVRCVLFLKLLLYSSNK